MKIIIPAIVFFLIISLFLSRIFLKQNKIKNTAPSPTATKTLSTPEKLLTAEDTLKKFVGFIKNDKISDAVALLSVKATKDEKSKQQWETNFKSILNISLARVDDFEKAAWTDNFEQYKIIFDIKLKPGVSENYGWTDGDNIRWITLEKDNKDVWKITEIATGP
ncbi:MAG: hypothetical protein M1268_02760 [Patescibacteria group bacterium]|nr:hypothetical protein [Patescibacteria group bacterium]